MPIEHTVDTERNLIVARAFDTIDTADVLGVVNGCVRHPDFRPGLDVLSDHRDLQRAISPHDAKRMAWHLGNMRDLFGGCRWAAITDRPDSIRMLEILGLYLSQVPILLKIFSREEAALAWLESSARQRRIDAN